MLRTSKLKSLELGNQGEYVNETMFTDDTIVYMSADDLFDILQKTLKRWCKIFGVNFNIFKTVAVLVESKNFRERVIQTRKMKSRSNNILNSVKILNEGETTGLLGTFVGNGISNASIWMPTIEKIVSNLNR